MKTEDKAESRKQKAEMDKTDAGTQGLRDQGTTDRLKGADNTARATPLEYWVDPPNTCQL